MLGQDTNKSEETKESAEKRHSGCTRDYSALHISCEPKLAQGRSNGFWTSHHDANQQGVFVYLEYIIIFSKSPLNTSKMYVKYYSSYQTPLPCSNSRNAPFYLHFVYLGHIIGPSKLEAGTKSFNAIRDFKEPSIVTELQSFLVLCDAFP